MGPFFTALLLSVGVGVWVYNMLVKQTGYGNEKNALIGAGVAVVITFLVAFSILSMIM